LISSYKYITDKRRICFKEVKGLLKLSDDFAHTVSSRIISTGRRVCANNSEQGRVSKITRKN